MGRYVIRPTGAEYEIQYLDDDGYLADSHIRCHFKADAERVCRLLNMDEAAKELAAKQKAEAEEPVWWMRHPVKGRHRFEVACTYEGCTPDTDNEGANQ